MNLVSNRLGDQIMDSNCQIFFGNRNSQILELKKEYPSIQFLRLKQIHSDKIIFAKKETSDYSIEGDSLITKEKNLALCAITADCCPVLISDPESNMIAAIHAGWRGVANRIVPKTVEKMIELGAQAKSLKVWIGPHIMQTSFEVQQDVRDQLLASVGILICDKDKNCVIRSETGYFVNLFQILCWQLQEVNVLQNKIYFINRDTKTDLNYHSARRDKEISGRQISWILINK